VTTSTLGKTWTLRLLLTAVLLGTGTVAAGQMADDTIALYRRGVDAFRARDWATSIRLLLQAAQRSPSWTTFLDGRQETVYCPQYYLGLAYRETGNRGLAEHWLVEAASCKLAPADSRRLSEALDEHSRGPAEPAKRPAAVTRQDGLAVTAASPERAMVLLRPGLVALAQGDAVRALQLLNGVGQLAAGESQVILDAYLGAAYAWTALERPAVREVLNEKARQCFRAALALDPRFDLTAKFLPPTVTAMFAQVRRSR
jgi:tetratricopeptide (TPR) repeat protein